MTRKLDIGTGKKRPDGWETCDIRPGCDYVCNALHVSSLGKFDQLYCCMVLEHLNGWEVPLALADWYEALNFGGTLEIIVPDLEHIMKLLPSEEALHRLFGGDRIQDGPDDCVEQYHRYAFTKDTLEKFVKEAGFSKIETIVSPGKIYLKARKGEA